MSLLRNKPSLYIVVSITKIILGLTTSLLTFYNINIYEDPGIAIGLGFFGLFIFLWGISFFIFLGILYLTSNENTNFIRVQKNSYKSSFLFGLYIIINILLIFLEHWSKTIGIIILIIFILLHIILFTKKRTDE